MNIYPYRDLVVAHNKLGDIYKIQNNLKLAENEYNQSLEIIKKRI